MCTSPLIRFRAKRQDAGTFLASSSNWQIKSAKEIQGLFNSYSAFLLYMNNYMDYQYIPCRKCDECRGKYAQDWALRNYHESQMHKRTCFITFTIDSSKVKIFTQNEKLMKKYCKGCVKGSRYFEYPLDYSLNKGFFLDTLKRIRDYLFKKYGVKIRYFGCGEYGSEENSERAHYHMLMYGYDFPDKQFYMKSKKGYDMYLSEELYKLWPYGIATIQSISPEICAYTAKYCTKKLNYDDDQKEFEHYYGRQPEFLFMSKGNCQSNRCEYIDEIIKNCKGMKSLRDLENPYCINCDKTRGGLGYSWFLKYKDNVLKKGYCTIGDKKYDIPKYYIDLLKLTDSEKYDTYKLSKLKLVEEKFEEHPEEMSVERLEVRKQVKRGKLKFYNRE